MLSFAELAGGGGNSQVGAVDKQLWLACAGPMCNVLPVGAAVYYFPQGHAEQASADVDFSDVRVPPLVPCRVAEVRCMAEAETDEVFAKMRLVPLRLGEPAVDEGEAAAEAVRGAGDDHARPASFAKILTQSDANNGGGFSVPRFCAEGVFPELDYQAEPPVQNVFVRDVHGVEWKFRHIFRGTPRRHLLTTGWSQFVNNKKLIAGDSIVFLRGEDGQIRVGLRRAKRVFSILVNDEGSISPSGWDPYLGLARGNATSSSSFGGGFRPRGNIPPEDVLAAAKLAAVGQPFEVVHYPRASTPEFCVRAAAVTAAMQVPWCPGMRFKMAFESEDSSRISWFMGSISDVQPADPARWPQSLWRLLQVTWDEAKVLKNVKRVCPWLVELVSSMPNLHLPPFSPGGKRARYTGFPLEDQLFDPGFSPQSLTLNHRFVTFPESSAAAGIQGARHAQFASSFSDLHIGNLQQNLLLSGIRLPTDRHAPSAPTISLDLTVGSPTARQDAPCAPSPGAATARQDAPCAPSPGAKKADDVKPLGIMLFGQRILTEQQIKDANSSGGLTSPAAAKTKTDSDAEKAPNASEGFRSPSGVIQRSPTKNDSLLSSLRLSTRDYGSKPPSESGQEPGQCKAFVESETVGRNLDLSTLGSFEGLYAHLSAMFSIDHDELRGHLLHSTASGDVRHVGDEPSQRVRETGAEDHETDPKLVVKEHQKSVE